MRRRIEQKLRDGSLCLLGVGVSWDRPFPMQPVSVNKWPNHIVLLEEKTVNSTPYWRVTAFLRGAAYPVICDHFILMVRRNLNLCSFGSHVVTLVVMDPTQWKNPWLLKQFTLSALLLIVAQNKALYNTPVKKCDTEISIVLVVSCRCCSSSSLPPLPGHHRANRLIRQLIAAFSLSAGPLSFVFSFSLHVIL